MADTELFSITNSGLVGSTFVILAIVALASSGRDAAISNFALPTK
jgi:hypothetical protein